MAQPYIGQIMMFAGNFAPQGYLACDGSLQSIAENDVLFVLLGTTYGGDGQTTFALPDLRSRAALGQGSGPGLSTYALGQSGGLESVTLATPQLPSHTHPAFTTGQAATANTPVSGVVFADQAPAASPPVTVYTPTPTSPTALTSATVGPDGGTGPHENRQPLQAIIYCIATQGLYPSQS